MSGYGYILDERSIKELDGVHQGLVRTVGIAISICPVLFGVHDGIRELAQQAELVRLGASKTMNSKHLVQPDGYGHAVDLVPQVNGKWRWEWPLCYKIALAMQEASRITQVKVIWGGVWDRLVTELGSDMKLAVAQYNARHPGRDFNDGPHFQVA